MTVQLSVACRNARLDAIWPPSTVATPPPATVASVVEAALRRGAVQYNYTAGSFGYVPPDPGNV